MRKLILMIAGLVFFNIALKISAQDFKEIDIPYKKFVLENGLTVIIHEDHKAPVVAVNIWYHVGSKNEKPGKTGFAHLFEHLMFNGSEHFNDDYFKALDKLGATDLNGTTSNDRTNYFETVPVSAFDKILWLESDRMGYMVNAISPEKLTEQRGVVQNEKRQGENEPYGLTDEYMAKSVYPAGHPYSWTVIGSMDDLNAASLEDVKEWFKTYYGPNNAVLAIAGDVKTEEALAKVKKYFGGLPAGPPVTKYSEWTAKRTGTIRQTMQDRVSNVRLYKVWNVPPDGTKESMNLDMASSILGSGKTSRLYKRLLYDEQLAVSVGAYIDSREIGGLFTIYCDVKPGVDPDKVEKIINDELAKFIQNGPTQAELDKIKNRTYSNFIRGMERVGGFGGKSDILASNQTFFGNADFYKESIKFLNTVKIADLQNTAKTWLTDGEYVLTVVPFVEAAPVIADVDRKTTPDVGSAVAPVLPTLQRFKLSNGLQVVLSQRTAIPVVSFNMVFNAGYATDQFSIPGTANMAVNMMDEGTNTLSSLQISEELDKLGSQMGTYSDIDNSYVYLSTLKQQMDKSLGLFAEIILNPSFPQADFERVKKVQVSRIQREKVSPNGIALRILPKLLFGDKHPYANPYSGLGFEQGVDKITRDQLIKFQQTWIKPNNATLVVVGDITVDEVKSKLESYFKNWKSGDVPKKVIPTVDIPTKPVIYLMDKPGSIQSVIIGGVLTTPYGKINEVALEVMNAIIGGEFTSRINMNIREDKHWSYGASSFVLDNGGQRPYLAFTSVQSDKTKESVQEIYKEFNEYVSSKPATNEEVSRNQNNKLLQVPGTYETMDAVSNDVVQIIKYGLKDDFKQDYINKLKNLQVKDIQTVAKEVIKPEQLTWLIVGDKASIEKPLKEIGYTIQYIDADGNFIK